MKTYRVDDLGRETVFHLVDTLTPDVTFDMWEAMITDMTLGYTRYRARGGWRGVEESINIYRVATLDEGQVMTCIQFLLTNTGMKDVYVVHADGIARGHCLEEENAQEEIERLYKELVEKETWSYPSEPAPWDKEKLFPK